MKRKLIFGIAMSIIGSALFCGLTALVNAGDSLFNNQDLSISRFKVEAELLTNGDMNVVETIDADSVGQHMFARDIVYSKNNNGHDTNTSQLDFNSFSVSVYQNNIALYENVTTSFGNGNKYSDIIGFSWEHQYDELGERITCPSEYGKSCATALIYLKNGTSPKTTYVFSYTIKNAMTIYNDYAEINWDFVPNMGVNIDNIDVEIKLPQNNFDAEKDIYFYGHGVSDASVNIDLNNTQKIAVSVDRLRGQEEVEIRLFFPSNVMQKGLNQSNYINENGYDYLINEEQKILDTEQSFYNRRIALIISSLIIFGLTIALLIFKIVYIYQNYDKEHKSDFDAKYYRELPASYPPAEMGYLYRFKEVTMDDMNATLMDLIRRKYIKIDYSGTVLTENKPNYKMIYDRDKDTSSLKSYEKFLLSWYFDSISGGKDTLTLNEIDNYLKSESNAIEYQKKNNEWILLVTKESEKNDFFDNVGKKANSGYFFVGLGFLDFFLLLFGVIAFSITWFSLLAFVILSLSISYVIYVRQVKRRSKQGNEDFVRWRAFKNFLEDFSHFEDYPVPGVEVWEHYLVYATSFGIADLVEKQLRTRFNELHREQEFNDCPILFYSYHSYFRMRIYSNFSLSKNTIQVANAKRMASSSHVGGRGGFGGGSSFGGGGGGVRGR